MQSYEVPSMSCGHCVKAITNSIQDIDAQAKVDIDLKTKRVNVETTATSSEILEAIDDAGFDDAKAIH
ncbi:hypothetical protein LMG33818_002480 [Halomonadaceae bacterium LMG 33818]|uniref:heavy-metal-associated domain-containing protein n=1 Tax=Cernens ardua TaxID=3402176 RepID=UPI003EDC7355